jgi:hypothetical protein
MSVLNVQTFLMLTGVIRKSGDNMIGFGNYWKLRNQIVYMLDYDLSYDKIKIKRIKLSHRSQDKRFVNGNLKDCSEYFIYSNENSYYNEDGIVHKADVFRTIDSAVAEMRKRIKAKYEEHLSLLKKAREAIG